MAHPHPYRANHDHSDEHLNLMFTFFEQPRSAPPIAPYLQETQPPRPYWADHNHSGEHLNMMYTTSVGQQRSFSLFPPSPPIPPYLEELEPPFAYWLDHNHSDEHLNLLYTPVRQQRSHSPSPPHPENDSGYCSPEDSPPRERAKQRQLRVVNTTPSPPGSPSLLAEVQIQDQDQDSSSWSAEERSLSWSWSTDEGDEESSPDHTSEQESCRDSPRDGSADVDDDDNNDNKNKFFRHLRRARKRVGAAFVAAGKKFGSSSASVPRTEMYGAIGGLDGRVDGSGVDGRGDEGSRVVGRERMRVRVFDKVKRTLLRKEGPVHLTPAKVRFALDD